MDPSIHPSAHPLLIAGLKPLLRRYLEVIERYVQQQSIAMTRVEVSGFEDPEEGDQQVAVALWVRLPAQEAMEQWHGAGRSIEDWVNGLPDQEADAIAGGITLGGVLGCRRRRLIP